MDLIPTIRTINPDALASAARYLLGEPQRGDAFNLIKEGLKQNIPVTGISQIAHCILVSSAVRNIDVIAEIERARCDEANAKKTQPELF